MDYLALLKKGVEEWNRWRSQHPSVVPDLSGANLRKAYLFEANLSQTNLVGANLTNACLIGADLSGANLSQASLAHAYLNQANLSRASLSNANLSNANLSEANLSEAKLDRANTAGADFTYAKLSGTCLEAVSSQLHARQRVAVGAAREKGSNAYSPPLAAAPTSSKSPRFSKPAQNSRRWLSTWLRAFLLQPWGWIALPILGALLLSTQINRFDLPISLTNPAALPTENSEARPDIQPDQRLDINAVQTQPELTLAQTLNLPEMAGDPWAVALSPNQPLLTSGNYDGKIRQWNVDSGELLRTLPGHTDAVRSLAIASSGQRLASGSGDGVKVWQLPSGKLTYRFFGDSMPFWAVAISPDEKSLVGGSYGGSIVVWRLDTGELHYQLTGHSGPIWAVAIHPDGRTFASASGDQTIKVWDLQTGKIIRTLSGHTDAVRTVAISPDGQTLVSGSWDSTVKIWDLNTGTVRQTLSGHTDRVVTVSLSPDGQTLISGSIDQSLKVWDLPSGELKNTLAGHSDWVITSAFAPDRYVFASGSKDRTIRVWRPENRVPDPQLIPPE
ncbi:pentapeptide repeat-containing protein [Romeria aff. gracilis LEGE 07310]|uniref:Pentapeptide repeat-containing protein n=1 Tax=Vasconcelosia minhoensis LEGE 07310 TaxID=915328 RepID=A0A8J7B0K9_9CYAN|nr:pentapeptide repeat-containing protein [Romeria gracilis]MBE9080037.1 pentapeptide repeat-containing protein [Romeria aff. gracilis LEGE 07310]